MTGPTFTGPDGQAYSYADPEESPDMSHIDSETVPPPEGAPESADQVGHGESTPTVQP